MSFRNEIIKKENEELVVKLAGELDIYVSQRFKEEVLEEYNKDKSDICMDFEDLEYIDSTGLGSLIAILKTIQKDGKEIYLKDVNSRIRKLFKITKLEEMFKFIGD